MAADECGDLMHRACKLISYTKVCIYCTLIAGIYWEYLIQAVEIKEFGQRCAKSMQLGLVKYEIPILELIEEKHSFSDALSFLKVRKAWPRAYMHENRYQAYKAEFSAQSWDELCDMEYVENMDYGVLPPSASHSELLLTCHEGLSCMYVCRNES